MSDVPGYLLIQGDARTIPLADGSVHCCVTSPPYFGLRNYGTAGQIGLETTPDAYVAKMVAVFAEVRRVLRDDGTCWLNLGDSYAANQGGNHGPGSSVYRVKEGGKASQKYAGVPDGLKPKNLIGIPWRVAFALQADGWYLRSDIIWHKPNPMPESVKDRPTKAHEYLFMLSKGERYHYDADAVREPLSEVSLAQIRSYECDGIKEGLRDKAHVPGQTMHTGGLCGVGSASRGAAMNPLGRNRRSVWSISTAPFRGAHFATMPLKLALRCLKAGTSRKGCCPVCHTPWRRLIEKVRTATRSGTNSKVYGIDSVHPDNPLWAHNETICGNRDPERHTTVIRTMGWAPGCKCPPHNPVPCLVFDPFNGAGTSGVAALALGHSYVGIDLKPEYLALAARRISRPHARIPRPSRAAEPATTRDLPGQGLLFPDYPSTEKATP
jgi:DNA modification methylase